MSVAMITLVLGGLLAFYLYFKWIYGYWSRRGIPTVSGIIPGVGHLFPLLMMRTNMPKLAKKWYKEAKNSSMAGYYEGTAPGLMVREPDLVKVVLQTSFSSFHKNALEVDPVADPLTAKNPFFTYGEEWQTGRKRLTYAFSSMRLKMLAETVQGVCKKFHAYLEKNIGAGERVEYEMKDLFSKFTGEVVANAGFGIEGFCFDDDKNPQSFREIGRQIFEPSTFYGTMQSMMFFLPFLNRFFKIRLISTEIDHFFRTIVNQVIESRREKNEKRNDFFQLMVDLEKTEGKKFDVETLTAHGLSFFLDGYETSSATLGFIAFELSVHPEIQDKLRDSIQKVLAKHNGGINYDSLKEMTYLDQVISESQRLHTLLDLMGKVCTETIELRGSDGLTCRVEPGTKIIIPVHNLQRDPRYWTDPEVFDPDRWNEERKGSVNKFAYLPFGEGPRICVGSRMGLLQTKAAIAALISKYKIERNPKTSYPPKMSMLGVLSTSEEGLWVYLKRL